MDRAGDLDRIAERARATLDAKHRARELTIGTCRRAIQACAASIRAVHRGELDTARSHADDAAALLEEAHDAVRTHPDVGHAGPLRDAEKEYAEARLTFAFVNDEHVPDLDELDVSVSAYLGGMAEAASELRRDVLDDLRAGHVDRAAGRLATMDAVYGLLVTIDYPDALTGGLRRSTDALRAVLERTRGDQTNALVAERLRLAIEDGRRAIEGRES